MGAIFCAYSFTASDEKTLKKSFMERLENERFEHGNSAYSGVLGGELKISEKVFKNYDEADNWISQNTNKWGYSLAVRVGDFKKAYFNSVRGKKLLAQVSALSEKVNGFDDGIISKLGMQKSAFKACQHCQSKISIKHFVANKKKQEFDKTICPICGKEFLKTEKMMADFKKWQIELNAKKKELEVNENEFNKKLGNSKPFWVVGGWAAS